VYTAVASAFHFFPGKVGPTVKKGWQRKAGEGNYEKRDGTTSGKERAGKGKIEREQTKDIAMSRPSMRISGYMPAFPFDLML
jgi:hypothetical protein